jgi:hypothetical protein
MGEFNENFSPGCNTMAQCGEEISLFFNHFSKSDYNTIYIKNIAVGHPSLSKPVKLKRHFEYNYGVSYAVLSLFKNSPNLFSLYWLLRIIAGIVKDFLNLIFFWNIHRKTIFVSKITALWDVYVKWKPTPRSREKMPVIIDSIEYSIIY